LTYCFVLSIRALQPRVGWNVRFAEGVIQFMYYPLSAYGKYHIPHHPERSSFEAKRKGRFKEIQTTLPSRNLLSIRALQPRGGWDVRFAEGVILFMHYPLSAYGKYHIPHHPERSSFEAKRKGRFKEIQTTLPSHNLLSIRALQPRGGWNVRFAEGVILFSDSR
jgi:hypothetical protein